MDNSKNLSYQLDLSITREIERAQEEQSKSLRINNKKINKIPPKVFELKNLESIDLSGNNLSTIPNQLLDLPNLKSVNLLDNPLIDLPDRPGLIIDGSTYLRCRKKIKPANITLVLAPDTAELQNGKWIDDLKNLKDLQRLVIGKWAITIGDIHSKPSTAILNIINSLSSLKYLNSLSIRGFPLKEVPEGIKYIPLLKNLRLDALGLNTLPSWLGELNIEFFSCVDNTISTLPDSFRNLKKLEFLDLSWNSIENIPPSVFDLTSLEKLRFNDCAIREIPSEILRLQKLNQLDISINAEMESPPTEVARKGLESIRDYWRQRADTGVDYLCEAKLIILGEPGAGKTSLARKIKNPNYKLIEDEKSTEGIDVIRYQFPTSIRVRDEGHGKLLQRDFQVSIWDFGGQEIYHATHQFFLTRRSVYLLVCDDRKEDTDFSYWLHVVQMLSDASPLLIIQNEKQDRTRDINLSGLRAQFSNLQDALATNLDTNRGLDRIIQTIQIELEKLPHIGVGLPSTWKRVREALEKDVREYISLNEYLTICEKHGFRRREDKLQLSGYLHDLGICLHFQDDPLLKNFIVLKPSWGTDAVYRVLDAKEVISSRGQFTRKQIELIWSEKKYAGMHDELLGLMMKFQLCYALESGNSYIAPQLLSHEQPAYSWDSTVGIIVRYEYDFFPKGIITRFTVAMHRLIAGGKLVWKSGLVIERDGSRAEIVEEYSQRRIRVRVSGLNYQGLLAIVDEQLERLHASFPRLQYERFLPCPCGECCEKADPYGFALEKLIRMARRGNPIQCHASGEMVDAGLLVREVLPGALRIDKNSLDISQPQATSQISPPVPEVFVSYAWTTDSCAVVDNIQEEFEKQGIRLIRDREEIRYKNSIRDFMRRIGQGKCVVVVISEKYLKSENCMFEMIEISKAKNLRERIFPIVLPDANIYKATGRIRYVQHWESEIRELDEALKTVRGDSLIALQDDLNIYAEIRRMFDGIADSLRDMNALTPDLHETSDYEELIRRIRAQIGPK